MSEGSPVHNLMAISGKLKCGEPGDSSENNPANCKERREISRKRSYYRCTHKNDLGCQATKQVQRADDDPSFFEITYRGVHSCQIDPRLVQIQLPFAISQIGSNTNPNSNLSRTLVFGADCNLQSNTTTDQGLHPTHFNSSSRQSSMSRFGSDSGGACKVENENFDVFGKSQVSTMFPYSPNLAHIRPPEGNTANTALQPNRHSKISVSLFRKQASEGENFTDFFPQQHNECVAFSEGELGVSNFAQIFGSPATSDSNYITLPPAMPFMNLNERVNTHGQPLQTSESDLTEVISGHTSAADSPMLDMDMMFNTVNLDSLFQFERSEPF